MHDILGGRLGLFGELAHLVGDDGEATAGRSCTCRFDGCIEREQIGLLRDATDRGDELVDVLGRVVQRDDFLGRVADGSPYRGQDA